MSNFTKEQLSKIIAAADEVLTALAGTNEEIHRDDETKMCRAWDYLNDIAAPPEVVKRLAEIALASLTAEPDGVIRQTTAGRHCTMFAVFPVGTLVYTAPPVPDLAALVPDGWKLVPVEPTESMIVDGFESEPDDFFSPREEWEAYEAMSGCQQAAYRARLCWAAMLATAPDFGTPK